MHPHLIRASLDPPESKPKRHLDMFSSFCTAHGRQSLCFTVGRPFPLKIVPWRGIWAPSNGSLNQPESTSQTASRSVEPFFAGLMIVTDRPTDRQTERPRYSVYNNRPRCRMRPRTCVNNRRSQMDRLVCGGSGGLSCPTGVEYGTGSLVGRIPASRRTDTVESMQLARNYGASKRHA